MLLAETPKRLEVLPVPNHRRQNREAFTRLFQGFVVDFGDKAAERMIWHFVRDAGGLRLSIPANNGDPLFGCSSLFRQLWINTCAEFGPMLGRAAMQKILIEFSDQRVTFPDIH